MQVADLIFTGFNRRVAALHRSTGEIIWQWKAPEGYGYTTLLLDRDLLVVSSNGYMYGLEALTGLQRWVNRMEGFGTGTASLASLHGGSVNPLTAIAAATETAAASTAATSAAT